MGPRTKMRGTSWAFINTQEKVRASDAEQSGRSRQPAVCGCLVNAVCFLWQFSLHFLLSFLGKVLDDTIVLCVYYTSTVVHFDKVLGATAYFLVLLADKYDIKPIVL